MKLNYTEERHCNFQEAGFWSMWRQQQLPVLFLCRIDCLPHVCLTFIRLTLLQRFLFHQMDGSPQAWCMCEFLWVNLNVVGVIFPEQKPAIEADNWFLYHELPSKTTLYLCSIRFSLDCWDGDINGSADIHLSFSLMWLWSLKHSYKHCIIQMVGKPQCKPL